MLSSGAAHKIEVDEFAERFPLVNYDFQPFGNRVFVQIRYPLQITKSGIVLDSNTVEDAYRNEQVGIVRALGESCFTFMTTGAAWPGGQLFEAGDCVRVPLHGGDNHWELFKDSNGETKTILFKTFKDYEIMGLHKEPLKVKTNYAYF